MAEPQAIKDLVGPDALRQTLSANGRPAEPIKVNGPSSSPNPPRPPAEPICTYCRDFGWLYESATSARLVRCPRCGGDTHAKYLRDVCGLPAMLQSYTWSRKRSGKLVDAHRAAERLIPDPRWFFTVLGPFGSGKTGLLAAAVNAGRTRGMVSVYTTAADMFDYLREAFDPGSPQSYQERMELFKTAQILAIDELDRFKSTSWAEEKFFQITEHRYENGGNCLTLFASNLPMSEIPGYLRSRMEDSRCQVHTLPAGDHRKAARRAANETEPEED